MTAPAVGTYLYRCTEAQLEEHLERIAESGHLVEHVVFKGGRDYAIVVRPEPAPVRVSLDEDSIERLAKALASEQARQVNRQASRGRAQGRF